MIGIFSQSCSRQMVKRNAALNRFLPENAASKPEKKGARFSKMDRGPTILIGQGDFWPNFVPFHPKDFWKSPTDLWNRRFRVTRGPVGAVLVLCCR